MIDYEKEFHRFNRAILWDIMCKRGYPKHLIDAVSYTHLDVYKRQSLYCPETFSDSYSVKLEYKFNLTYYVPVKNPIKNEYLSVEYKSCTNLV